jgi:predicted transcriptional regulator
MSAPTVRMSKATHRKLKTLAAQTKQPMIDVLDKAVEAYQRQLFFEKVNAGYAALRRDRQAWSEHTAERKSWEKTLVDGLDADEHWTEQRRPAKRKK